jgi:hypothetical protein
MIMLCCLNRLIRIDCFDTLDEWIKAIIVGHLLLDFEKSVFVCNEDLLYEKLKAARKGRYPLKPRMKTAKITIHISQEAQKSPGIAAYLTGLLYRNGITIIDAFLGYEDVILILDESDGPRAYTILEEETSEGRK